MTQLLQDYKFNASTWFLLWSSPPNTTLRTVEGLMYTAPACVFWLFIGSMVFEV